MFILFCIFTEKSVAKSKPECKNMPSGDRTGPAGQGPATGRRLGYCSGFDSPGYLKGSGGGRGRRAGFGFSFGRGMGRAAGYGRGRGWGYNFPEYGLMYRTPWAHPMTREEEISLLKEESEALKRSQEDIEKRLSDLEKKA